MKTATANASRTCPAWCAIHDDKNEVCLGEATVLDFPAAGPLFAKQARVNLGYNPAEGVTVAVNVGHPDQPLTLADADTVADVIKAKVAEARNTGNAAIPAPRSSSDDTEAGVR